MKIYVASHDRWAALWVAHVFREHGYTIVSRWIDQPFNPTPDYSPKERGHIAIDDYDDVLASNALVLVAGPDRYSGGKFVEVGIVMAAKKHVIVIGRRENMLLWHPSIHAVDTPDQAAKLLLEIGCLAPNR